MKTCGFRRVNFVSFCFCSISTLVIYVLVVKMQHDDNARIERKQLAQDSMYVWSSLDTFDQKLEAGVNSTRSKASSLENLTLSNRNIVADWTEMVKSAPMTSRSPSTVAILSADTLPTCPPPGNRHIVCIKVHKAASTTAVAILERYGYRNNMTLAVKSEVKYGPHILSSSGKFQRKMVYQWQRTYNMLTNHVRYNRAEMDVVVPNASYVTIIRHPVKHFESAFVYFIVAKHLNIDTTDDPIAAFFEKPEEYFSKKFYFWFQLRSGQIFDLGLDHEDHTGPKVATFMQRLEREFDLVMIADYFDESLILLRKHLCLDWKDILYLPDNFRMKGQKMVISNEVREKIEVWNWADMTLYQYFNRTFWEKVRHYPNFQKDLQYFRNLLESTKQNCTTGRILRKPRDAHGVRTLELRKNASDFCRHLMLGDVDYTKMFRERQKQTLYNRPIFWDR